MRGEEGGGRKAKDCLCGVCEILILFSITQENAGAANENRVMLRSSTAGGGERKWKRRRRSGHSCRANKWQGHAAPLRNLHKHIGNPILVATSKDCKSREARTLAGIENSM